MLRWILSAAVALMMASAAHAAPKSKNRVVDKGGYVTESVVYEDGRKSSYRKSAKKRTKYRGQRYVYRGKASKRHARSGRHVRSGRVASKRARGAGKRYVRSFESYDEGVTESRRSRTARSGRSGRTAAPRGWFGEGESTGGGSHYQSGIASYYWQPQRVASGGWFNPNAMTAAHRSLPFGTRVRVTHRASGRSVVVTINDRGPYIGGRVIDLSRAAASALGMTGAGLANVSLSILGR